MGRRVQIGLPGEGSDGLLRVVSTEVGLSWGLADPSGIRPQRGIRGRLCIVGIAEFMVCGCPRRQAVAGGRSCDQGPAHVGGRIAGPERVFRAGTRPDRPLPSSRSSMASCVLAWVRGEQCRGSLLVQHSARNCGSAATAPEDAAKRRPAPRRPLMLTNSQAEVTELALITAPLQNVLRCEVS
jgi:hypothetical protein